MIKQRVKHMVLDAARTAHAAGVLASDDFPDITLEEPKIGAHGDLATNFAMAGAAAQKMASRKIAEAVVDHITDPDDLIEKTEIAGPGFINFFIRPSAWLPVIHEIHQQDTAYGAADLGGGQKVQVEFVSANPTGPLHIGHGRGAVVGDSIAALLDFCGYRVEREYYINDAGRQILTLGGSVYLRCCQLAGQNVEFPEDAYQGDYIKDIARSAIAEKEQSLFDLPRDRAEKELAGLAAEQILAGIRQDLENLGVCFDRWYSEQTLYDTGKVEAAIAFLKQKDLIYEHEGALWFCATSFGDEKDRVVVRQNGQTTYFASDIAYHLEKYERGYDRVIDVWGADHHGYVPRLTAAIAAMGRQSSQFTVILTQLVNLLRNGRPVSMSTRAGQFVTLSDVINEVGRDAARFIFLTRHHESPLDFDLEVAKAKTNDNPVYYVQYVHARISSICKKAADESPGVQNTPESADLQRLSEAEEIALIKKMGKYPEVISGAAALMEPHRIAYYLMDLAALFHAYYNKHRVLTDDTKLSTARLHLVVAVQKVIRNGLKLLGVSTPEIM
ncbi:arginyl-tRNA synthetase [Desulfosalsimonas propionicica]|uniref:Arginine--tRNA ligase n=1 Tax=Desulfosalsimonas propionicica TaxID=332175 RepID=A0A7W0C661_9BACT|nr:arginine--tRNA ligase [Desulfosalsimonas propionicica]MBA2879848.1 arginyl-tRNA synthetase [Desulfosalsimonas propionicica]